MESPAPGSAIARLRAETELLARRAWRSLALFGDAASWLDYRLYLCRMYGFVAPIEAALGEAPGLAAVIHDAGLRNHKIALLSHDLVSLGVDRRDLGELPRIAVPPLAELPEALGWMYVVEAATLEGRELARHLASRLPHELESSSAYLRCYGAEARARWRAFAAALDAYTAREDGGEGGGGGASDRVVAAATDCLVRLHRWLAPSAQDLRASGFPSSARRTRASTTTA
jgi:heme oxygenase